VEKETSKNKGPIYKLSKTGEDKEIAKAVRTLFTPGQLKKLTENKTFVAQQKTLHLQFHCEVLAQKRLAIQEANANVIVPNFFFSKTLTNKAKKKRITHSHRSNPELWS
jgi:hypothetical protein